jgi:plasmid maintenance system antidote protein VapI
MGEPVEDGGMSYSFDPDWVVAPGETLRDCLAEIDVVPPEQLARAAGISRRVLARLLAGDEPITEDLAERIARMTAVPARMWLALEHNYRVGLAAGKERA